MRDRVLITGPGGRVGPHIVPLLREHFSLRLFDAKPLRAEQDDEVVRGDIQDFAQLKEACRGVDTMIHLAAISDEADFQTKLLPVNLAGLYNAFEAAKQTGVKRVIFTSTGQTVLNYPKGHWITPEMPARPSTVYACTKLFGEALARYYSDIHHLSMICIRLCYFQAYDSPLLRIPGHDVLREWCSPRDLAQLLVKSIRSPVKFAVFFGVSANTGRFWDITNARELVGYEPEDNAADYFAKAQV